MRQASRGGTATALIFLYLPPLLLLLAVAAVSQRSGQPVADYLRDPASSTGAHPLLGLVSNVGVLAWCAALSCSLLGVMLLRGARAPAAERHFLIGGAALTALLMLDDLFLLHQQLYPQWLGVPEALVLAFYAICGGLWLMHCREQILASRIVLLITAVALFSVSLLVDWIFVPGPEDTLPYLLEDGAKLLGIASWLGFFVEATYRQVGEYIPGD